MDQLPILLKISQKMIPSRYKDNQNYSPTIENKYLFFYYKKYLIKLYINIMYTHFY